MTATDTGMSMGSDAEIFVGALAREQARRAAMARAGKNRRVGYGHPTTSDPDYTPDEIEFMAAVREFQNRTGKKFPTWSEVLRVARSLGYAKNTEPCPFDSPL